MIKNEYRIKYSYFVNWNCGYDLNKMLQLNGLYVQESYLYRKMFRKEQFRYM